MYLPLGVGCLCPGGGFYHLTMLFLLYDGAIAIIQMAEILYRWRGRKIAGKRVHF